MIQHNNNLKDEDKVKHHHNDIIFNLFIFNISIIFLFINIQIKNSLYIIKSSSKSGSLDKIGFVNVVEGVPLQCPPSNVSSNECDIKNYD